VFIPAIRDARDLVAKRSSSAKKAAELRPTRTRFVATDPEEAERLYAEAQKLAPTGRTQASARIDAMLRAEADRSVERATAAWGSRDLESHREGARGAEVRRQAHRQGASAAAPIERDLVAEMSQATEAQLRDSAEFANTAGLNPAVVHLLRDRLVDKLLVSAQALRETGHPRRRPSSKIEAKRLRGDVKTPSYEQACAPRRR